MKLLVHSQTSTVQPLKFGNRCAISSPILFGMWSYIPAGIKVNSVSEGAHEPLLTGVKNRQVCHFIITVFLESFISFILVRYLSVKSLWLVWSLNLRVPDLQMGCRDLTSWPGAPTLQWRHNEGDGVSNRLRLDCLTFCSSVDQRKHQSSTSLVLVRGIHRSQVDSPHKGPVTRKMFPCDDVIRARNPRYCCPVNVPHSVDSQRRVGYSP